MPAPCMNNWFTRSERLRLPPENLSGPFNHRRILEKHPHVLTALLQWQVTQKKCSIFRFFIISNFLSFSIRSSLPGNGGRCGRGGLKQTRAERSSERLYYLQPLWIGLILPSEDLHRSGEVFKSLIWNLGQSQRREALIWGRWSI